MAASSVGLFLGSLVSDVAKAMELAPVVLVPQVFFFCENFTKVLVHHGEFYETSWQSRNVLNKLKNISCSIH